MPQKQPPPAMRALRATYDEARHGRETAESLTPLLALLEPPDASEGGPLDEIKGILSAILDAQGRTLQAIDALTRKLSDGAGGSRP